MSLFDGPAGRLRVEVAGSGTPVTVFAHGLGSSAADLSPLAARIGGTRVLFDFRGHGGSDSPDADHGVAGMRADLAAVAGMFEATNAIGVSMGAGAIIRMLSEEPARFERIVLVSPSAIDDPCPDPAGALALAERLEREPLERIAGEMVLTPDLAPLLAHEPRWEPQIRGQIMRMNATGVPRALRAYAGGEPPLADATVLARVRAPVLVAGHEGDPNHPAAVARRLGGLLPRAVVEIWPTPFAMMLDDLDAFAARAASFLTAPPTAGKK